MYYHVIACQVFQRELCSLIAKNENSISVTWLPQGLHETPAILTQRIKKAMGEFLEDVDAGRVKHLPDAFLLCYGLCSNGTVGLRAERIPIVVPKTDDCIALFLGSQKRYLRLFNEKSGTYWLNNGWIETSFLPTEEAMSRRRQEYAEKYGEDNADFLMEQETLFIKNYRACGYIPSPVYESAEHADTAAKIAEKWGLWLFTERGELSLIEKLISGEWNEEEFLVCPPGYETAADYDGGKLRAVLTK